jgi:hypothetical protein
VTLSNIKFRIKKKHLAFLELPPAQRRTHVRKLRDPVLQLFSAAMPHMNIASASRLNNKGTRSSNKIKQNGLRKEQMKGTNIIPKLTAI